MTHARGFVPLNADLSQDLKRLDEALLGDWPLGPPPALQGQAEVDWWCSVCAATGTDPGTYYDHRSALCRLFLDVFQMRLYGPLRDNAAFEEALGLLGSRKGQALFMSRAMRDGYDLATMEGALAANPHDEALSQTYDVALSGMHGSTPSGKPVSLEDLLQWLRTMKEPQLAHEIEEMQRTEGFTLCTYDWGMLIDGLYSKVLFSFDMMALWHSAAAVDQGRNQVVHLALAQRLFSDWAVFGSREPQLLALRETLAHAGTPLDLHFTTNDANTVVMQFEVTSSKDSALAFGQWFRSVYLPVVLPRQAARAMDPAFDYPLLSFPR